MGSAQLVVTILSLLSSSHGPLLAHGTEHLNSANGLFSHSQQSGLGAGPPSPPSSGWRWPGCPLRRGGGRWSSSLVTLTFSRAQGPQSHWNPGKFVFLVMSKHVLFTRSRLLCVILCRFIIRITCLIFYLTRERNLTMKREE